MGEAWDAGYWTIFIGEKRNFSSKCSKTATERFNLLNFMSENKNLMNWSHVMHCWDKKNFQKEKFVIVILIFDLSVIFGFKRRNLWTKLCLELDYWTGFCSLIRMLHLLHQILFTMIFKSRKFKEGFCGCYNIHVGSWLDFF